MEQQHLPHHIAELIFKHYAGSISAAEQARLDAWLAEDAQHRQLFTSFRNPALLEKEMAFFDRLNVDADWEAVAVRAGYNTNTRRPRRLIYWSAAAAVALLTSTYFLWPAKQTPAEVVQTAPITTPQPGSDKATLQLANGQTVALGQLAGDTALSEGGASISGKNGQLVYNEASAESITYNTLTTPRGGQFRLTLADGTVVWLNASSSLHFPTRFTDKHRTVELTGEGFFEVSKNHEPFYVVANGVKIAVLGTRFNVSSYNGTTRTTLAEGAVKIQLPGNRNWQLAPGQQALVEDISQPVKIMPADVDKALAWKNGLFYFKDDALTEIIGQIARWYDVDVSVKGPLPVRLYSGNIRRQASLDEVLEMLEVVSGAKTGVAGNKVTIQF